jgi:hypothetical protein
MTDHLFISAGMHYYVAGRYAVFAGLNPTAANLLHHANRRFQPQLDQESRWMMEFR